MRVRAPPHNGSAAWAALAAPSRAASARECAPAFALDDMRSPLGPVWILGMPFLRYYYTVFDRAASKVHIARSAPSCEIATEPVGSSTPRTHTAAFTAADF